MHTRSTIRRQFGLAASLLALAVASAACQQEAEGGSGGGGDDGTYRVVVIADQTGDFAAPSSAYAAGAQTFLKTEGYTSAGGHDVEVVDVLDSQSTPQGTQARFRQARDMNPDGILSFQISTSLAASLPVMQDAEIPVISASYSPDLMYPEPQPWFFATGGTESDQVTAILNVVARNLGGSIEGKKLALASAKTAAFDAWTTYFEERAETDGFEIVALERNDLTIASYGGQAAKIVDAKPDAVVAFQVGAFPVVVNGLNGAGFTGPIVGNTAGAQPATLEAIAADNFSAVTDVKAATPDSSVAQVADELGFSEHVANPYFAAGYVNAFVLWSAMDKCGETKCSPSELIDQINTMGPVMVPNDMAYGPQEFTVEQHSGLQMMGVMMWDTAAGAPASAGDPVPTKQ